jgi:uncharacterized protein YigE (DUF2233 family)
MLSPAALESWRRQIDSCDFVVMGGDLSHRLNRADLRELRTRLEKPGKPLHWLPGNHDRGADTAAFAAVLGARPACSFIRHCNAGLLLLDLTDGDLATVSVREPLLAELARVAAVIPDSLPLVVFSHFSLHPAAPRYAVIGSEKLFAILDRKNVVGFFSGHHHGWWRKERKGVPFFGSGTMLPGIPNHDGSDIHGCYIVNVRNGAVSVRVAPFLPSVSSAKKTAVVSVGRFLRSGNDSTLLWTGLAAERKTVEQLHNSGCEVRSHLIRSDSADAPSWSIEGHLSREDTMVVLSVKLRDSCGHEMASAPFRTSFALFRRLRSVLGTAVLHALGFDPSLKTFSPVSQKKSGDPLAYACSLASNRTAAADKKPALPVLLAAAARSELSLLDSGISFRRTEAGDVTALVWFVDPCRIRITTAIQTRNKGVYTDEVDAGSEKYVAINGGFFEMDTAYALSPSGLLVSGGREVAPLTRHGGSALFTLNGCESRIEWSKNFVPAGKNEMALQCGPMVVEPDGRNGILSDDNVRLNRTAIGISGKEVVLAVVYGKEGKGLSLFELGELLRTPRDQGGAGCDRAMNLDGGASTQATMRWGGKSVDVPGLWPVNNVIVVVKQ